MNRLSAAFGIIAASAAPSFALVLPLQAQVTFTVNSTLDGGDANTADDVCATAGSVCTLRAAIQQANATAGLDYIYFDIAGAGPHTISTTSPPDVTDAVTIDGYTQAGASENTSAVGSDAVLMVRVIPSVPLFVTADAVTVRGLVFSGPGFSPLLQVSGNDIVVEGNFFGTSTDGNALNGDHTTALQVVGDRIRVGGTDAASRNVAGGGAVAIDVLGDDAVVQGNLIGVDVAGTGALPSSTGLRLQGSGALVGGTVAGAGNVISGHLFAGLEILGPDNVVEGNRIGTDATGTAALPSATGVEINGALALDNVIGGTEAAAANLISGHTGSGVVIDADDNLVQGNRIGTDVAGTVAIPNQSGVEILSGATNNRVGGAGSGAGNLVSGNTASGIEVSGDGNFVEGNFIGTDVTGSAPLANDVGVFLTADANTIGGTEAGAGNVVSGNTTAGISIDGADNVLEGNHIGTDVAGTAAVPNGSGLVLDDGTTTNTRVGGTATGAGNVISGNTNNGIELINDADGNFIEGNLIGVDVTGTVGLPNGSDGILLSSSSNTIGGAAAGAGNVISANAAVGVTVSGGGNTLEGNWIGTDAGGTLALGNGITDGDEGVRVTASGNVIVRNTIAHNYSNGVTVAGPAQNVRISENSIRDNAELGIDLGGSGVTANDNNDSDSGPNGLQNFPVVTQAWQSSTVVRGILDSSGNTLFTLEFFTSPTCDASDHGEAVTFLGSTTVTTNGGGDASFEVTLSQTVEVAEMVVATATNPTGATSEFSPCIRVAQEPTFVVTTTDDTDDGVCSDGHCSLVEAVEGANARSGLDLIHFDIPGPGPHAIADTQVPDLTDVVVIDGYTQTGASPNTNPLELGSNASLTIDLQSRGLVLDGVPGSTVRGLVASFIEVHGSIGAVIEGNFLGTSPDGTSLGPFQAASTVLIQSNDVLVGGTSPESRNVIAGGTNSGVDSEGADVIVQGNLIGTNATGTASLANGRGVVVNVGNALIGGGAPGAGNLISGNALAGVFVDEDFAAVQGNRIGTTAAGDAGLPNGEDGVFLSGGSNDNLVGGTGSGEGNLIAFNGRDGVRVDAFSGNAVLGNAIHGNGGLGIDLDADGVTANDPGDGDSGPNGLRNFPVLDFAAAGSALIEGTISADPSATFRLEFFANQACSPSGHGEGARFLGFADVTTDGVGDATFSASFDEPATAGEVMTATLTDAANNTSEFSACLASVGYTADVSPASATRIRGQSADYDVTVTAAAGTFDRDVTLSCPQLPAGASCAFVPPTVQPGAGSATSTLTLSTTAPTTPTGASNFTVAASHDVLEQTAQASITLTDFTVTVDPASGAVARGSSVDFTVSVDPDGPTFDEAVDLTCASGLPTDATCSFSPAQVTPGAGGGASTLTVTTAATTPLGPATLTVQGSAAGLERSDMPELAVAEYALTVSADDGTVRRGEPGTFTITIEGDGGSFPEEVALSCEDLPAGADCTFVPAQVVPGASATAVLTLGTSEPETPVGSSSFTVRGVSGSIEATVSADVTVEDFAVSATPATVRVTGGQDATFAVSVAPEGAAFGEEVALGCAGLPAGLSCSFAPAVLTPDAAAVASVLTISTTALATAGVSGGADSLRHAGAPWLLWALLAVLGLGGAALRGRRVPATVLLLLLALAGLSCTGDATAPPDPVTSTVTIEGTSGSLARSVEVTVTVE